jgi:hypothetical protein
LTILPSIVVDMALPPLHWYKKHSDLKVVIMIEESNGELGIYLQPLHTTNNKPYI